eukprot:CAMPEP_0114644288 /NCGR_PEP_ID=MMETSP0191-20121206/3879_1 /TAXON_ID=126664 /ORGANISM="Sorites sp." /LENGTH=161 /DNA_ID=CAMNT_0001856723 /DNA_START=110 /DNA_END=592 /DNA_ORIENTATION=-
MMRSYFDRRSGRMDGMVPCVRNTPAFQSQCASFYTDRSLAVALTEGDYDRVMAWRKHAIEYRVWQDCSQWFLEMVRRMQPIQQHSNAWITRLEEAVSAEFLRLRYPDAKMCPNCGCGPVFNEDCFDLQAHHNEISGDSRINNACPACKFFSEEWEDWSPWD